MLLAACDAPPPFACPADATPTSWTDETNDTRWACLDDDGRPTGRWERRAADGGVAEEGAFAAGARTGPWRVARRVALFDRAHAWRAEGAFDAGVPVGDWTLEWRTERGDAVREGRWSGAFVDGAPATTTTLELADALASVDALPAGPVLLRLPVLHVRGGTIAPSSHACASGVDAGALFLGDDAVVLDGFLLFAAGWRGSVVGEATASMGAGPDPDVSRIQVPWKGTGRVEAVVVFDSTLTDPRGLEACVEGPRPVARVLAWRGCAVGRPCDAWAGFWDAAFSRPTAPEAAAAAR